MDNSSEVFQWLKSISSGLNLERLYKDFEIRGFTTRSSLRYLEKEDIDGFFPSPHKLLLAKKRILVKELDVLKSNHLQPKELFAPSFTGQPTVQNNHVLLNVSPQQYNTTWPSTSTCTTPFAANSSQHLTTNNSQVPSSYLDKRQQELNENLQFMKAQIESAKSEISKREKEMKECVNPKAKICSNCHGPGHNENKCPNEECPGFEFCKISSKLPALNKELSDLKSLMKEVKKKEERAKNDLDAFVCAQRRAATSFFAVMRPRLRKQNPMKYIERSALDKDLLILKKALENKIPIEESIGNCRL